MKRYTAEFLFGGAGVGGSGSRSGTGSGRLNNRRYGRI